MSGHRFGNAIGTSRPFGPSGICASPCLGRARPFRPRKGISMKVLVTVKRVVDPNVVVRVKSDGTGVDVANLKMSMNPFDEIAVEQAVRFKEAGKVDEIVAVTVGPKKAEETLRAAMATGADRAIRVDLDQEVDSLTIAKLLKGVFEREKPDVVLMGKQSIDNDANQTGQMLAGLLGCAQGCFVSAFELKDGKACVTREVDGGLEDLELTLPCVVTCDLRLNEPRFNKLPDIMKAKKKPLQTVSPSDLGVEIAPQVVALRYAEPKARPEGVKVASVDELIDKLKNEAKAI